MEVKEPHYCIPQRASLQHDVSGTQNAEDGTLNQHVSVHTGEKAYKCCICAEEFIESESLKKHMPVHSDKTPFKCDICGKEFAGAGKLKRHVVLHTGITPHKCDVCGKGFALNGNLKTHMVILLRARRNEKEFKVKPATSFKYFQYLLTENLKQSSRQKKYYLTVP